MFKFLMFLFAIITFLSCRDIDPIGYPKSNPEMVIIDSILTTDTLDHGFFYFKQPTSKSSWRSPRDYYNGQFYYRFEIINYPSDTSFLLSICIWSDINYGEYGNWLSWKETCSEQFEVQGKNILTYNSSPSAWWNLNNPVDFARIKDFDHMGLVLWCNNRQNLSDWTGSGNSCWEGKNYILPLKLRLTVVAVANGYVFSGWENYIN